MRTSPETTKIFPALAKAQGEMTNPPKNADNPFFKSEYADHPTILNMVRPILAKHGLALAQSYGEAGLTTTLTHESGEWMMTDPLPIKAEKMTAQGIGSAITYARRYAVCAIFNIAGESDDDGNAASEAPKQEQKPASTPAAKPSPAPSGDKPPGDISKPQVGSIKALCGNMAMTAEQVDGIKVRHNVQHIDELSKAEGSVVITELLERFLDKVGSTMDTLEMPPDERDALYEKHGLDVMKLDGKALRAVSEELSARAGEARSGE